jgi:hypothetical protein
MSLLDIFTVMKVLPSAQKLDQIYFKRYLNCGSARGADKTVYGTAISGHLFPIVFAFHFPLQASRDLTDGKTIISVLLQMVLSSPYMPKTIHHLWCYCWWGWSILVWYPFYALTMLCRVHIKHARYLLFAAIMWLWF